MSKMRFGVLGAGFIGRQHMKTITDLEESAQLTAVFDPVAEMAKKAADEHGAETVFDTAEELMGSPRVDAVIVASPNKTHADLAIKSMRAGKHVIVEKPLSLSGKAAAEIVKTAEETGLTTLVAHQMRWSPSAAKVRKLIDDGELGDVYYAKTSWFRTCGIPGWGSWFTRFDESGGGPLIDIGVHMLDLSLYLMGGVSPVSVYGSTYAKFGPRKQGLGTWGTPDWDGYYDVEDLAGAMIKMDNGATLVLEVSWAANVGDDLCAPRIALLGSEGGASTGIAGGDIQLSGMKFGQSFTIPCTPPATNGRLDMTAHFVERAQAGEQTIAPVKSGMVNNVILDAIYESSKTGKSIDVDWKRYGL